MEIFELLESLEDIIERSRNLPFSAKGVIDKEQMLDLIKEIRLKLPDELNKVLQQLNDENINIYDIRKYGRVDIIFIKRKG